MELKITQSRPGCADGLYEINAKGCAAASLHWATEEGPLSHWQMLAYLPLEPDGVGRFSFGGGRAVPGDATHVLARALRKDGQPAEEILMPIRRAEACPPGADAQRFLVLTDLHLSSKPWQVRKPLSMAKKGYDALLITGDMTNDGTQEQLELFWECVSQVIPEVPVLAVTGNHDYPAYPLPQISRGICDYAVLQQRLLERAAALGVACRQDSSGAYAAAVGDTQILGLNAATHWRRFKFPENDQLDWLRDRLRESKAKRHIILCHAPLAKHRPWKEPGETPYLSRDKVLQEIVDEAQGEVIFLSGHTHISVNSRSGCVESAEGNRLYINAGSIRPTVLKPEEPIACKEWTEGNVLELLLDGNQTQVTAISVKTGKKMPRCHYRFPKRTADTDSQNMDTNVSGSRSG